MVEALLDSSFPQLLNQAPYLAHLSEIDLFRETRIRLINSPYMKEQVYLQAPKAKGDPYPFPVFPLYNPELESIFDRDGITGLQTAEGHSCSNPIIQALDNVKSLKEFHRVKKSYIDECNKRFSMELN